MTAIAVLGSMSNHGGTMITANTTLIADGLPVCTTGDLHACPIYGHGVTPVFGFVNVLSMGEPVLTMGSIAGCGAVLVTGIPTVIAI
jgi:uncharacterized Zn-binding protein involved in type VI secretion